MLVKALLGVVCAHFPCNGAVHKCRIALAATALVAVKAKLGSLVAYGEP
ncbi:MAG: hypothetical protein ACJAYX_004529 [Planctomycetota bacterium]